MTSSFRLRRPLRSLPALQHPSSLLEMETARRALEDICCARRRFRNSLPIVVEAFDILSRHRRVDAALGEVVGEWIAENHDPRFVQMWIGQMVAVAYSAVCMRQDKILNWVAEAVMERYALGQLTVDGICSLAAAFAKLHFFNSTVFDRILDEINKRGSALTAKQYAVLTHAMASVGYRRGGKNPLPSLEDTDRLSVRESSSIIWACATLEWECDVRVMKHAVECCKRSDASMSSVDVNNIITALAYGRGNSDGKIVNSVVRCSLEHSTCRPTASYARQLAALLAEYPVVIGRLTIGELERVKDTLGRYHCERGEVETSAVENAMMESLAGIAHSEGFGFQDSSREVGWYTVDIIIDVNDGCCCFSEK
ncbi:hypothetical protein FOZ62_025277 [Perkinsus olseni]|uniref:Uncharacterized protein n=1 Tax=Perkinsus olseni TaxID=32597 RepID=A0A7J6QCB4_PEROL|nr:hypothetical protein FOZ62_025277 [Perkinsus olseni]